MSKPRLVALVACVALLATVGCRRGAPETTEEPTVEPSPTPSVQTLGEFQLLGTVQQAFIDLTPDIEIPSGEQEFLEEGTADRVSPEVAGVMRIELEAFSDNLRERCDADPGDRFLVYWTDRTLFDPLYVNTQDMETRLDGRELGLIGTAFLRPEAAQEDLDDPFELDSPTPATAQPTGSPAAGPGLSDAGRERECVLVAEQVGTSEGTLPTPRPRPSPTGSPTGSPTARPTANPTGTAQN